MRSDSLFFAGFIPYLVHLMWKTTMFSSYIHGTREILFTLLCLGLMIVKVMLYDHFSTKQLLCSALMLITGALTYYGTGKVLYFALMVMVVASKGVDFDKILGVWLIVVITIMLFAFTASLLDIIPNLKYVARDFFTRKKIFRNSFGIIYPTDFAAHVFFCMLSLFYLRRNYLKWYDFVLGITTGILVYYFCRAKLDTFSIFLTVLLFLLALILKKNDLWKKAWGVMGVIVTPITCVGMIALTYAYKHNGILEYFNRFISGRLAIGKSGIEEYGITLFGQKIRLIGLGGATDYNHIHINFLDISYINMLVVGGVVFLFVLMLIYVVIGYSYRKNTFLICALFIVTINCAIAHHMQEIEYNIFTLALFATLTDIENKGEKKIDYGRT